MQKKGVQCKGSYENRGVKYDKDKLRWHLLPMSVMREVIKVLEVGARKYGDFNWHNVEDKRTRYYNATMRHLSSWWEDECDDKESGVSHLAHAICSLIFILWEELQKTEKKSWR